MVIHHNNFAEQTRPVLATYRDKIQPCPAVVISFQTRGPPIMLFWIVFHTAFIIVFSIVAALAAAQGGDPEARNIIQSWQDHYEASMENIDDYVVVMDQQTIYYKKAWDNGQPYFKSRVKDADQQELASGSNLTDAAVFSRVYEAVMQKRAVLSLSVSWKPCRILNGAWWSRWQATKSNDSGRCSKKIGMRL